MDARHVSRIIEILGENAVIVDAEACSPYGRDETEDLYFPPELVALPENTSQISALLQYCNEEGIAVTPRGGGTGLSGGALPVCGGLLLSMERMNRILEIDLKNLQARVESGVITEELMQAAASHGLYYPIDPSSKGSCFIGGNIAHGSGGPRVVKYGGIREYVLNLEVVLADGSVIWTGANTLKYAAGYNLTQLMIGSEGTLGIITKAVLKLIPLPQQTVLLMAAFPDAERACAAVAAIFMAGAQPSALEFMERKGVEWVCRYEQISFKIIDQAEAYLLIEIDGNEAEQLRLESEKIYGVLERLGCLEVLLADSVAQKESLWAIRRRLPHSVKARSIYKEEDTVVPRAALPELIAGIKALERKYGFESVCYGHAGDGNLHVNILKGSMDDLAWTDQLTDAIRELFELSISLGGSISGEHGIGLVQREFMDIPFTQTQIELMRGIKKFFDPKGILNPRKIF